MSLIPETSSPVTLDDERSHWHILPSPQIPENIAPDAACTNNMGQFFSVERKSSEVSTKMISDEIETSLDSNGPAVLLEHFQELELAFDRVSATASREGWDNQLRQSRRRFDEIFRFFKAPESDFIISPPLESKSTQKFKLIEEENASLKRKINRLLDKTDQLWDENTRLHHHHTKLEKRLETGRKKHRQEMAAQEQSRNRMVSELRSQINCLNDETKELRRILQCDPSKGEPMDSAMIQAFEALFKSIQKLVLKRCPNAAEPYGIESAAGWVQRFYATTGVTGRLQKLRLRGEIFGIFHECHIQKSPFGVREDVSACLRYVEEMMQKSDECKPLDVTEWRRRTVTNLAKLDNRVTYDEECENLIGALLQPALKDDPQELTAAKEEIYDLCKEMYALALLLRQSRSDYSIYYISEGVVVDDGHRDILDIENLFGPTGAEDTEETGKGSQVVLTLFGGLQKVHHEHRNVVNLSRARVVCRLKGSSRE